MGSTRKYRRAIESSLTHKGRATYALDVLEDMSERMQTLDAMTKASYRQALVNTAMIGELFRELHSMGVIDLADKTKFPRTYEELFGSAETITESNSEGSPEGETAVEDNAETTEIYPGDGGRPEQRDGGGDSSGVQSDVSEGTSEQTPGERDDPGRTSEALRGLSGVDLDDSRRLTPTHSDSGQGRE